MRLVYDSDQGVFDLALTSLGGIDPGIGNGGHLEAAVWVSLFSDCRAEEGDIPAELGPDRRGWWGDYGLPRDRHLGSHLWLHYREKRTEAVRLAIENEATAALQWLVDDGIASAVAVTASWMDRPSDALRLIVTLTEPNGVRRDWKADLLWGGIAG